jgi:hypothetical protein
MAASVIGSSFRLPTGGLIVIHRASKRAFEKPARLNLECTRRFKQHEDGV